MVLLKIFSRASGAMSTVRAPLLVWGGGLGPPAVVQDPSGRRQAVVLSAGCNGQRHVADGIGDGAVDDDGGGKDAIIVCHADLASIPGDEVASPPPFPSI